METWEAIRLEKVLDSGRTRPLLVECEYTASARDENRGPVIDRALFVVKSLGHPEITVQRLFCESFGNLLARRLGLNAPRPVLVNVSEDFVAAVQPGLTQYGINLRPGIAAACEFIKLGFRSVVPGTSLTPEEFIQATAVFGFDLVVQNPDRRIEKPNCGHTPDGLIIFDFEWCFSFIYEVLQQYDPWRVSKMGFLAQHLFYKPLKNRPTDWSDIKEAVRALSEEDLNRLVSSLPDEWQKDFENIRSHLLSIAANASEFEHELQRSLL